MDRSGSVVADSLAHRADERQIPLSSHISGRVQNELYQSELDWESHTERGRLRKTKPWMSLQIKLKLLEIDPQKIYLIS